MTSNVWKMILGAPKGRFFAPDVPGAQKCS